MLRLRGTRRWLQIPQATTTRGEWGALAMFLGVHSQSNPASVSSSSSSPNESPTASPSHLHPYIHSHPSSRLRRSCFKEYDPEKATFFGHFSRTGRRLWSLGFVYFGIRVICAPTCDHVNVVKLRS